MGDSIGIGSAAGDLSPNPPATHTACTMHVLLFVLWAGGAIGAQAATREDCMQATKDQASLWASYCGWDPAVYGHSAIAVGKGCTIFKANAGANAAKTALDTCAKEGATDCEIVFEDGNGCKGNKQTTECHNPTMQVVSQTFHAENVMTIEQMKGGVKNAHQIVQDMNESFDAANFNVVVSVRQTGSDPAMPAIEIKEIVDFGARRIMFMERAEGRQQCRTINTVINPAEFFKRLFELETRLFSCAPKDGDDVYSFTFPPEKFPVRLPLKMQVSAAFDADGLFRGEHAKENLFLPGGAEVSVDSKVTVKSNKLGGPSAEDMRSLESSLCEPVVDAETFLTMWESRHPSAGLARFVPSFARAFLAERSADIVVTM